MKRQQLRWGMVAGFALSVGMQGYAQMGSMPMTSPAKAPAVPSTSLVLTVAGKTATLTIADLKTMPQKTITVHNQHTKADETYTGVALSDLLARYGFPVDKSTHQAMLRSYLRAEGTDKYWVLFSVTEVEASEHTGEALIATTRNGKDLGADGGLKLIAGADKKPERWVRNLAYLSLVTIP